MKTHLRSAIRNVYIKIFAIWPLCRGRFFWVSHLIVSLTKWLNRVCLKAFVQNYYAPQIGTHI